MRPPLQNFFFSDSNRPPLLSEPRCPRLVPTLSLCVPLCPMVSTASGQCEPSPPCAILADSALPYAILDTLQPTTLTVPLCSISTPLMSIPLCRPGCLVKRFPAGLPTLRPDYILWSDPGARLISAGGDQLSTRPSHALTTYPPPDYILW